MPRLNTERSYLVAVLILGLTASCAYLGAELFFLDGGLGFPLDDSWIHLQFARNLAIGDGLTYNPAEPVAGSTAPLWTAILSIVFLLPGSVVLWVKLLGMALTVAALHAVFVLGRELGLSPGLAAFAGAMTALTNWMLWASLSGMEIPLFVWLSLWGIIWHCRERRSGTDGFASLLVLGLAVLARPEGLLLLVLAAADRIVIWQRSGERLRIRLGSWRAVVKGTVVGGVLLAPVATLNWRFSGSLLPTTFAAKSGAPIALIPDLRYVYDVMNIFIRPQPYLLLLSLAGVLVLVRRLGGKMDRGLLLGLWLVALPLAYSTLQSPWTKLLAGNFGRYFFPLFPVVILLGTLALSGAAKSLGSGVTVGRLTVPLRLGLVLLIVWPTLTSATLGAGRYLQSVVNVEDGDVRIAKWLQTRVDARAVLAVNDVGAIKYLLPNRVVDLAGIIHPRVARYIEEARAAGQDWHLGVVRILEETRPDFLVIFPGWYPDLERFESGFVPRFELSIPANIAMGGDRIVVYSTPWTRYPLRP